jgi:hypothetical protein
MEDWVAQGRWEAVLDEKRGVLSSMMQVLDSCHALLDATTAARDNNIKLLQHILRWARGSGWRRGRRLGRQEQAVGAGACSECAAAVASAAAAARTHACFAPSPRHARSWTRPCRPSMLQAAAAEVLAPLQLDPLNNQLHQAAVQELLSLLKPPGLPGTGLGGGADADLGLSALGAYGGRDAGALDAANLSLSIEKPWDWQGAGGASGATAGATAAAKGAAKKAGAKTGAGRGGAKGRGSKAGGGAAASGAGARPPEARSRRQRFLDVEGFWRSCTPEERRALLRVPLADLLEGVKREGGSEAAEELMEGLVLLRESGNVAARYWLCPACGDRKFGSSREFLAHVGAVHEGLTPLLPARGGAGSGAASPAAPAAAATGGAAAAAAQAPAAAPVAPPLPRYLACSECGLEVVGSYYKYSSLPGHGVCLRCFAADAGAAAAAAAGGGGRYELRLPPGADRADHRPLEHYPLALEGGGGGGPGSEWSSGSAAPGSDSGSGSGSADYTSAHASFVGSVEAGLDALPARAAARRDAGATPTEGGRGAAAPAGGSAKRRRSSSGGSGSSSEEDDDEDEGGEQGEEGDLLCWRLLTELEELHAARHAAAGGGSEPGSAPEGACGEGADARGEGEAEGEGEDGEPQPGSAHSWREWLLPRKLREWAGDGAASAAASAEGNGDAEPGADEVSGAAPGDAAAAAPRAGSAPATPRTPAASDARQAVAPPAPPPPPPPAPPAGAPPAAAAAQVELLTKKVMRRMTDLYSADRASADYTLSYLIDFAHRKVVEAAAAAMGGAADYSACLELPQEHLDEVAAAADAAAAAAAGAAALGGAPVPPPGPAVLPLPRPPPGWGGSDGLPPRAPPLPVEAVRRGPAVAARVAQFLLAPGLCYQQPEVLQAALLNLGVPELTMALAYVTQRQSSLVRAAEALARWGRQAGQLGRAGASRRPQRGCAIAGLRGSGNPYSLSEAPAASCPLPPSQPTRLPRRATAPRTPTSAARRPRRPRTRTSRAALQSTRYTT